MENVVKFTKITIAFLVIILLVGCKNCTTGEKKIKNKPTKVKTLEKEIYTDLNNMPIGLYQNKGNLVHVGSFDAEFSGLKDIAVFQIFPSDEDTVVYTGSFANYFYEKWSLLSSNHKIGFNVKYSTVDGKNLSYNILSPSDAFNNNNYLLIYLYDDYYHRNDSWYSHVEADEYNDETLFTSIKLTCGGDVSQINSSIILTVFTYDTEDDFDLSTKEYRGKSKYSIEIKRIN